MFGADYRSAHVEHAFQVAERFFHQFLAAIDPQELFRIFHLVAQQYKVAEVACMLAYDILVILNLCAPDGRAAHLEEPLGHCLLLLGASAFE